VKKALFILLLASGFGSASAQFSENNAIYAGNEFNAGSYFGMDLSLNYAWQEKYCVKLGYNTNTRIAKTIPSDYNPGLVGILTFGMNTPRDNFRSVYLAFGYIAGLNRAGTARVNLAFGLGYVMTRVPVNWQKTDGFMSENYTWDYEKAHSVSFVINPKFEFPFSRYWGLSISPMLQFYDGGTYFVVGIGHIFGLTRGPADQVVPSAEAN
jgi:hypothetical protein